MIIYHIILIKYIYLSIVQQARILCHCAAHPRYRDHTTQQVCEATKQTTLLSCVAPRDSPSGLLPPRIHQLCVAASMKYEIATNMRRSARTRARMDTRTHTRMHMHSTQA